MAGVSAFPCRGSTRRRRLPVLSSDRPILVTGAGGFVGGRVVEMLQGLLGIPVRASVRRWTSAARIGRLPAEIVLCDIADADQVRRAMDGVRGVVHCAYGDPAVFVEGTRTVLQAALEAGVDRVVHLSTMEVYGDVEGVGLEAAPLRKTGWSYRDSKVDAELACRSYMDRGLPVSILRPTIVYGPFSRDWTARFAERLVAGGTFPGREDCQGTCNLVYIDDLVAAIVLALDRKEAAGAAFNVNGEERLTWGQYLNDLSRAIGPPPVARGARRLGSCSTGFEIRLRPFISAARPLSGSCGAWRGSSGVHPPPRSTACLHARSSCPWTRRERCSATARSSPLRVAWH